MKKNDVKTLVIIVSAYVGLCFLAVFLFNSSTFSVDLSGNNSNNTATALSGYTAPVIGLISIILIYLAYSKQTEANNILKNQNEDLKIQSQVIRKQQSIEFILSLFESIDREMKQAFIRITSKTGDKVDENIYKGFRGFLKLHYFINEGYVSGSNLKSLGQNHHSRMVVAIANSFQILIRAINASGLPENDSEILTEKAQNFYYSKLSITFNMIIDKIDKQLITDDEHVKPIKELVKQFDYRLTLLEKLES